MCWLMLDVCGWLLFVGCWLLVGVCGLIVVDYWLFVVRCMSFIV